MKKQSKLLLNKIKQALRDYQSNKELEHRQLNNRIQRNLIVKGLEDRGI